MNIFKKKKSKKLDLDLNNNKEIINDNIEKDNKLMLQKEKEIDDMIEKLNYKEINHVYNGCTKDDEFCECDIGR